MKKITYLVQSSDHSHWVWKYWHYYFVKNFEQHPEVDVVLMSETVAPDFPNVKTVKTGTGAWGETVLKGLNQIDSKYIVLTHEDYLLIDKIDYETFFKIVSLSDEHNLSLVKMIGEWAGWTDNTKPLIKTDLKVNDNENLFLYPNEKDYLTSHQVSLWNKEFLKSTIKPYYSPWTHEIQGSNDLRKRNIPLHAYCGPWPIPICESITQGRPRGPQAKEYLSIVDKGEPIHV